jgi:hypothetical protein
VIVTELTREALKIRREMRDLTKQGYRRVEVDWRLHRGVLLREHLTDVRIAADGRHVWYRISESDK